ncbi:MAG: 2-C-methyl-D-erythritol 2,4-cyclodiphosphate synthase [Acidimicrobiia bacterium]|nr:2-C-methyl-D-erythritol 2,4-cyclodiphosphate synthase [Acidimicrobiia bacterium]
MRVGFGVDAHRFGGSAPLIICGVLVDSDQGVEATSDGDVAIHALMDAMLGAGALGDLGLHFPSSDPRWHGASSIDMLRRTRHLLAEAGLGVVSVDVTVIAQSVRIAPNRDEMRARIADALQVAVGAVSVKATSTDGMGFIGSDEGIAATAVVTVVEASSAQGS